MINNKHYVHRYSSPSTNESIIHNGDNTNRVSSVTAAEPLGDPAAMLMHEDTPMLIGMAMNIKERCRHILEKTGKPWKTRQEKMTNNLSLEETLEEILVFYDRLQLVPNARGLVRRGDYEDTDAIVVETHLFLQLELQEIQRYHGNLDLHVEPWDFKLSERPPVRKFVATAKKSTTRKRKQSTPSKKPRKTRKQKKSIRSEPLQAFVGDNESMPSADANDGCLANPAIIEEDKDLMELFSDVWQSQDPHNDEIVNLTAMALLEDSFINSEQTVAGVANEDLSVMSVPSLELEELGVETFESWANDHY